MKSLSRKRAFHLDIKIPPPIDLDKAFELASKIYDSARDVRIYQLSQIRQAIAIAQYYTVFYPRKAHDIFQAAMLGVSSATDRLTRKGEERKSASHILNYTRMYIHRFIIEFLDNDHPVMRLEWKTLKRKQIKITGVPIPESLSQNPGPGIEDLLEMVDSDDDREIIRLLAAGYTQQELEEMGISRWRVRTLIKRLRHSTS